MSESQALVAACRAALQPVVDAALERFIASMQWDAGTSDYVRTLVIGNARGASTAILDDAAACMAEREATLREALQRLEWCKEKAGWTGPVSCCPVCYGVPSRNFLGYEIDAEPQYEPAGHKADCWLRAALAAARAREATDG